MNCVRQLEAARQETGDARPILEVPVWWQQGCAPTLDIWAFPLPSSWGCGAGLALVSTGSSQGSFALLSLTVM